MNDAILGRRNLAGALHAIETGAGSFGTLRGDKYLRFLALLLLGYACFGRAFAYLGVAPVFPGEIGLALGLPMLFLTRGWYARISCGTTMLLLCLMAWGAVRTFPYLGIYGIDALRDGATWGYGFFALIMAGLVAVRPERLVWLVHCYRRFVTIFIPIAAVTSVIGVLYPQIVLLLAWGEEGSQVFLALRNGEVAVHMAAILVFVFLGLRQRLGWIQVALTVVVLGLLFTTGRAAMLTIGVGFALYALFSGWMGRGLGRYLVILFMTAFVALALDLNLGTNTTGRHVALQQVLENFTSLFGNDAQRGLIGTKLWRLNWWERIIDYTVWGPYFLLGKGFGINLATSDGFQVLAGDALRSPHSIHFTWLARGGVPGLMLWLSVLASWGVMVIRRLLHARRAGDSLWARLFVFLLVYFAVLLTNASFDVYLEGPGGAIWFWSVFGIGIAAARIYDRCPEVLWPKAQGTLSAGAGE